MAKTTFTVEKFNFSEEKCFIICEIGNNHNGNFSRALEMIDIAADMGVDCVKFQMRNIQSLYKNEANEEAQDLGSEYVYDLIQKFELTSEEHRKLAEYAKTKGLTYLCTPWDEISADKINEFGANAFKVASADFSNLPLISHLLSFGKPLLLSTGMSDTNEIKTVTDFLNEKEAAFALLHCCSTYPAPFSDINLNWLHELKKLHPFIGYSGHERGIYTSIAAFAMGAKIIERHFTLDRNMEGPDHAASLEKEDFKNLVEAIREIEVSKGYKVKFISQGAKMNRENLAKSLIASASLQPGHVIRKEDIEIKSPGQGLSPLYIDQLIGKKLPRAVAKGDYFFPTDLSEEVAKPEKFEFSLKWGIPVRYHDFEQFSKLISPDIYEFHLSYKDMNTAINDLGFEKQEAGLVVHAPELFENSHLMDITTADKEYVQQSLDQTQRVIDITRSINERYFDTARPLIVANVGGFSMDQPISAEEKERRYVTLGESLNKLDLSDVELIPQTMAPFPWHFGGQRYQNLFIEPDEIYEWCNKLNLRICLDISHSALACNHLKLKLSKFLETVAPVTAHLHVADAEGTNGEGLQIGEGSIDFGTILPLLHDKFSDCSFIPEIWQGHKNQGLGFWTALERLSGRI